jgi:hypothetical protein
MPDDCFAPAHLAIADDPTRPRMASPGRCFEQPTRRLADPRGRCEGHRLRAIGQTMEKPPAAARPPLHLIQPETAG